MAAVIATRSKYHIFVDGRYWDQAGQECFSDVFIHDIFEIPIEKFVLASLPRPRVIGLDARSVTHDYFNLLGEVSSRIDGIVKPVDVRPLISSAGEGGKVHVPLPIRLVRTASLDKLRERVRSAQRLLPGIGTDAYYSNDSRLLGWLTGLGRSGYDMLLPGSCFIKRGGRVLVFLNKYQEIGPERLEEFANNIVQFAPMDSLQRMLPNEVSCAIPNARVSEWEWRTLRRRVRLSPLAHDPFEVLRSVRDTKQLSQLEEANVKDAVAVTELFADVADRKQRESLSEYDIATLLDERRAVQPGFIHLSFPSIVAAGPNSAVPHYHVEGQAEARTLKEDDVLLIDSGSHYEGGTTDITRTVCFGSATPKFCRAYSLVLKAHVGLARARFRSGSRGYQLDTFARRVLWKEGLDFEHGTGHGVGFLSHVHDLPFRITKFHGNEMFFAGMVVTIEPGLYFTNEFGIRIENMYAIESDDSNWLRFRVLTKTPIPTDCVDWKMLEADERAWVLEYNQASYNVIGARLSNRAKRWIQRACPELA